ncbi:unnamed protein product, partial [Laminaria digitata]
PLCAGHDADGGLCGKDDALAMSTGGWLAGEGGRKDLSDGDLAVPRCRGELIAVEAIRALHLLSVGLEEPWKIAGGGGGGGGVGFTIERQLEAVLAREGACERAAALACHVLAKCAGAG